MTAKSEASRALYEAFRAALLLTASAEAAEHAVLGESPPWSSVTLPMASSLSKP